MSCMSKTYRRRLIAMRMSCSGVEWIRSWFSTLILLTFVLVVVHFLPKPSWICAVNMERDGYPKVMGDAIRFRNVSSVNYIDPELGRVGAMFQIYTKENENLVHSNLSDNSGNSGVHVFKLLNFNFSNFGRTWLNTPHRKIWTTSGKSKYNGRFSLEKLRSKQKLPDCVRMKVSPDATPTKICVHYPKDDNFISNRLRDFGEWEYDFVFQLAEFFTINPNAQLVDLGCNVGVFTLFAASLNKPALAVDILPSNLALIQLSIATNDEYLAKKNDEINEFLKSAIGAHRFENRSMFSELVTTLHNAIHSRRQKMYVYLKDGDGNLGGTEVKELNIVSNNASSANENKRYGIDGSQIVVDAVCLDDLIPYVRANMSVFLKMDIEGSEPEALDCASNFFMYVDVKVILMEILFHRYSEKGRTMAQFLLRQNMMPSADMSGREALNPDVDAMHLWPENMFWVKFR